MRLYLDDNILDTKLVRLLTKAGHQVLLPSQLSMTGKSDPRHLAVAIRQFCAFLTRNHDDFLDLHELVIASGGNHFGILAVRYDNDARRDMKSPAIVIAIAKLEAACIPLGNSFHILNQWR
jgi:predicted nuclease of predicted toxin-antitoxin system